MSTTSVQGQKGSFTSAAVAYLLTAFTGCLIIALVSLASRNIISETYTKLSIHEPSVTYRSSNYARPFDLVVGVTQHKTGTFQLHCIQRQLAAIEGLAGPEGACLKDNNVSAADLRKCIASTVPSLRPAMFKTHHTLQQSCKPRGAHQQELIQPWKPCLSLMLARSCSKSELMHTRRKSTCSINLPSEEEIDGSIAIIHEVRNPIDTVISAYMFHVTLPKSEPWLYRWKRHKYTYAIDLKWLGVSDAELDSFGFKGLDLSPADSAAPEVNATVLVSAYAPESPELEQLAYGELLVKLPPSIGVIMEFWHTLPELYGMARQYRALKARPKAIQARFEDFKHEFNTTMLRVLDRLQLHRRVSRQELLNTVIEGGCDPGMWDEKKRAKSTHITADREHEKRAIEAALLQHTVAKKELCRLAHVLDYDDPRCHRPRATEIETSNLKDDDSDTGDYVDYHEEEK